MTADVQRELAEALRSHVYDPVGKVCSCGVLCGIRCDPITREGHVLDALLPTVQALIAEEGQRAAAAALRDLADDFDNGPFYAQATRYFADRDVDADGMDVARIIRAAALDPAGADSGEGR